MNMRPIRLLAAVLVLLGLWGGGRLDGRATAQGSAAVETARIGVLAYRGTRHALDSWQPLADYLSAAIPDHRFQLVPVTLVSAPERIAAGEIDYLITNPGHYVTLDDAFGLGVLATRVRHEKDGAELTRFGTVIFARKGSGITTVGDLRGRSLAAVSPDAFGGFQMAWRELTLHGLDPFSDLGELRFMGFPQDAIVQAVRAGEVDAGVVRSGLLERLAAEGTIDIGEFTILLGNTQPGFPWRVSGHLYAEWPFTALQKADRRLNERIVTALLATRDAGVRRRHGLNDSWTAPLSYAATRKLVAAFERRKQQTQQDGLRIPDRWLQLLAGVLAILSLALAGLLVVMLRRRPVAPDSTAAGQPAKEDPELRAARLRFQSLTPREREILVLICKGMPSKAIAHQLGISPKTVEYHRANLLQKTGAGSSTQLVQLATRLGIS